MTDAEQRAGAGGTAAGDGERRASDGEPDVRWASGGEATLVSFAGEALVLVSTVPSPPGSRLAGAARGGFPLQLKVHGCRRRPDGRFTLQGRPVDLRREHREALEALDRAAREHVGP